MNKYYPVNTISRSTKKCRLYYILDTNVKIDLQKTITDCFYIRDHRNGRGERDLGRMCFEWIADKYYNIFLKIFKYIPEYGRWDDLLYIKNSKIIPFIYQYINNQINIDYFNMMIGEPITTCAKWLPTEGKSFARHRKNHFTMLLRYMKLSPKQYRQKIAALRKYLKIPEHHITTKKFHSIDYDALSKGALHYYMNILKENDNWKLSKNPNLKKQKFRKTYEKHDDNYECILNDLKLEN